jgi:hypothetical protein
MLTNQQSEKLNTSDSILPHFRNNASKVKYSFKLKDGNLKLQADTISILSKDNIILHNISAVYTVKTKTITIRATNCRFLPNPKKVCLSQKVEIISDGAKIQTERAIIDILKQNITCNSLVHYSNNNISFTCTGFLIQKNGEILLKNAKVNINKKLR